MPDSTYVIYEDQNELEKLLLDEARATEYINTLPVCVACDAFIYPNMMTRRVIYAYSSGMYDGQISTRRSGECTEVITGLDRSGNSVTLHNRPGCRWICSFCRESFAGVVYSNHGCNNIGTRSTPIGREGNACNSCLAQWQSSIDSSGGTPTMCDGCSAWYDSDDLRWSHIDNDDRVCVYCYDQEYECENCNNWIHSDSDHSCDDFDSYDQRRLSRIHSYSYKPDPIFFGRKTSSDYFFGVELEVESIGNNIDDAVTECYELAELPSGLNRIYLKYDGSIREGFEIVTHPHTLKEFQDKFPWEMLDKLRKRGFRSWNTKTCGLHVHVSKTAFNATNSLSHRSADKRDTHQIRFLKLIYDNKDYVQKLAGRKSSWATFGDKGNIIRKVKNHYQSDARYSAVNVEPITTYEVRVFKGSLRKERVLAAIEFVHAAVEYTRDLPIVPKNDPFGWTAFHGYVLANRATYPNLCIILDEMLIKSRTIINRQEETV